MRSKNFYKLLYMMVGLRNELSMKPPTPKLVPDRLSCIRFTLEAIFISIQESLHFHAVTVRESMNVVLMESFLPSTVNI
ncbi:hypothetical protein MXB_1238 [Myxobolus squamalis]|nr:hypothetical protein MXB_1238 [Myxobolus squamalis]